MGSDLHLELEILARVVLATVLAAPVGWERERRHRPAGLRTHMLVAASSALFVGVGELFLVRYADSDGVRMDPIRTIEAVVAGVAFLGAGTIFRAHDKVFGLTTAASLLATGAIGVASGGGRYVLAPALTIVVLLVLIGARALEREGLPRSPRRRREERG